LGFVRDLAASRSNVRSYKLVEKNLYDKIASNKITKHLVLGFFIEAHKKLKSRF